jgi:hypothetical protein
VRSILATSATTTVLDETLLRGHKRSREHQPDWLARVDDLEPHTLCPRRDWQVIFLGSTEPRAARPERCPPGTSSRRPPVIVCQCKG